MFFADDKIYAIQGDWIYMYSYIVFAGLVNMEATWI